MFSLGSFAAREGGRVAGIVRRDEVVLLEGRTVEDLLAAWDASWPLLEQQAETGKRVPLADLTPLVPVRPGSLIQSGMNYRKHVVDLVVAGRRKADPDADLDAVRAEAEANMDRRAESGLPFLFVGLAASMCGPYDDVVLPPEGEHDWELELAVVIGRTAFRVSRDEALDYVAGYVTSNDLTTRDLVFRPEPSPVGADWFRAKNAPTFFPTGPWLVPAAFVPDPSALRITLRHNGDTMQDESTADMIFGVARLIEFASATLPLQPGDLILTGSPAGNGVHWGRVLAPGDVLEGTITAEDGSDLGFGTQRNRCVAR